MGCSDAALVTAIMVGEDFVRQTPDGFEPFGTIHLTIDRLGKSVRPGHQRLKPIPLTRPP
jgi:hypothetical protein